MKTLILALSVVSVFTFSSCKKCYECVYSTGFVDECCEKKSGPGAVFADDCSYFKDDCTGPGRTLRNK